jgi:hypothetical protein
MLGMIWQEKAPEAALDVLLEFLRDDSIKLYKGSTTQVGGTGSETGAKRTTSKDVISGDARIMAVDAIKAIGKARWSKRDDIMRQLRALAADATIFPELRAKAQDLLK